MVKKFILAVLIISILIVIVSLLYKLTQSTNGKGNLNPVQSLPFNKQSIELPIKTTQSYVSAARVLYILSGSLLEVKPAEESSYELITDIKDSSVPKLIISRAVPVFLYEKNRYIQANVNDLKPNQKIRIYISYGLKNNRWAIYQIDIIR